MKLVVRAATVVRSEARTTRSAPKEQLLPRYQTYFLLEIEGMEPLKKLNPPKFNMYDGKFDSRSHIINFWQLMALWNHLDALMCRVFPSSMGDLRLKWFEKLSLGDH